MSAAGDGGVLDGRANAQPNLFACIIPSSISEPELISADTLFSSLAKVTFFSSFGSFRTMAGESTDSLVSLMVQPSGFLALRSLNCMSSPRLTLRELSLFADGVTNC